MTNLNIQVDSNQNLEVLKAILGTLGATVVEHSAMSATPSRIFTTSVSTPIYSVRGGDLDCGQDSDDDYDDEDEDYSDEDDSDNTSGIRLVEFTRIYRESGSNTIKTQRNTFEVNSVSRIRPCNRLGLSNGHRSTITLTNGQEVDLKETYSEVCARLGR